MKTVAWDKKALPSDEVPWREQLVFVSFAVNGVELYVEPQSVTFYKVKETTWYRGTL